MAAPSSANAPCRWLVENPEIIKNNWTDPYGFRTHLKQAISLGFSDLEDAMQVVSGLRFNAQCIVTRNLKDYAKSPIKALTPEGVLGLLV